MVAAANGLLGAGRRRQEVLHSEVASGFCSRLENQSLEVATVVEVMKEKRSAPKVSRHRTDPESK